VVGRGKASASEIEIETGSGGAPLVRLFEAVLGFRLGAA
jgi:hypothetical protein